MFLQLFSIINGVNVSKPQYLSSDWLHTACQVSFIKKYCNLKISSFFRGYLWISPVNIQSVSKKMVFCGKTAITSFKLIQNAKSGGVLENSGYLLRYGHWDFQNWRRNDWENEAWSCQPPLQKSAKFSALNLHWLILSAIL